MGHIQGTNRHEEILFPERLDDSIAAEHSIRFLDAFVAARDLAQLGLQRVAAAAPGRPASHPGALLKRSLCGALSRRRSSRRLEQATHRQVELMGLLPKLRPDHKPRAHVRRAHLQPLRQGCRACTLWCQPLNLCAGELGASDGSKGQAVPAQERHLTHSQLQRLRQQSDERIAGSRQERERSATEEEQGAPGGARAAQRHAPREARKQRTLLSEACPGQLRAHGEAHLALTDPASRAMQRGQGGGTEVCENVQPAVDATPKRIRACEVTHATSARDGRSPRALQAQAVLAHPCEAVADRGYDPGDAVPAGLEAGMTPSRARPRTSANTQLGLLSQEDCS